MVLRSIRAFVLTSCSCYPHLLARAEIGETLDAALEKLSKLADDELRSKPPPDEQKKEQGGMPSQEELEEELERHHQQLEAMKKLKLEAALVLDKGRCLGDVPQCHDYVEDLIDRNKMSAFRLQHYSDFWPREHGARASSGPMGAMWKTYKPPPTESLRSIGKKHNNAHLDFCDKGPQQILSWLEDVNACDLGNPMGYYDLSLDHHVKALSTMAGGRGQINLPWDATPYVDAAELLCRQIQNTAIEIYKKLSLPSLLEKWDKEFAKNEEDLLEKMDFTMNMGDFPPPYHQELLEASSLGIAGDLDQLLHEHAMGANLILRRKLDPFAYPCGGKETFVNAQSKMYNAYTESAIMLGRNTRLLMDHFRTSLGIKMVVEEVAPMMGGIEKLIVRQEGLLPEIVFNPAAYGRHWDVLDFLLASLVKEDQNARESAEIIHWRVKNKHKGHDQEEESRVLAEFRANNTDPIGLAMLEIGVAVGQNGNYLLESWPSLYYVGIDPTIHPPVRRRMNRNFPADRFMLVNNTSQLEVANVPDDYFDIIFIDGPHTYAQVKHDIAAYEPKVRDGGFLVGHDFSCWHPPLLWAVLESRLYGQGGTGPINFGMDGVWWWQVDRPEPDDPAGGTMSQLMAKKPSGSYPGPGGGEL